VYATTSDVMHIGIEAPKPITNAGKIYAFGNYIFQNDLNAGIHIIDNTNRGTPKKISFLKLPLSLALVVISTPTNILVRHSHLIAGCYII
jgi:hypothetical protein